MPPAGTRNNPANMPGVMKTIPLEEYTWAGIDAATFNPAEAVALGLPANIAGVLVDEVARGSKGDRAGVMTGDLIQEINGFGIYDADSLANIVAAQRLTGGVLLINRNGKSIYRTVPEV